MLNVEWGNGLTMQFCYMSCIPPSSPLSQLSSHVSSIVYSFPALLLVDKCLLLCQLHHDLSTTLITGIPMKVGPRLVLEWDWNGMGSRHIQEEQSGSGSASYDVELIHLSEAHRDILRGGMLMMS